MNVIIHPFPRRPAAKPAEPADAAWRKPQRPAYHPEEGDGDRSDWASLFKAACLILLPVALLALLLSR